jgi:hypothetical protein
MGRENAEAHDDSGVRSNSVVPHLEQTVVEFDHKRLAKENPNDAANVDLVDFVRSRRRRGAA